MVVKAGVQEFYIYMNISYSYQHQVNQYGRVYNLVSMETFPPWHTGQPVMICQPVMIGLQELRRGAAVAMEMD